MDQSVHYDDLSPIERLIRDVNDGPECFKCRKKITEPKDVRIVTVRFDGEPASVWMHAQHV